MNDKDNQAFDSWWETIYDESMQVRDWRSCENLHDNKYNMKKSWQAAVDYKQKEIDELDEVSECLADGYNHVKAKNKKLREAIREAIDFQEWCGNEYILENALKEVGEE